MAKKKNRRGKQSMVSKAANIGLLALSFARPIRMLITGNFRYFWSLGSDGLVHEATFGLSSGAFDLQAGAQLYGPSVAAAALFQIKKYAMKHYRVS